MPTYDAVVIGGGPAGLVGAIYLARFKRKALLIDAGQSRATRIPRSHNMPGFPEGIHGTALVSAMRMQAERYGAILEPGVVKQLTRVDAGFVIDWTGEQVLAKNVLLATGASDIDPAVPHLEDALRNGHVRYCPVCDGYEVSNRRVGVITNSVAGLHEALYLRHFTERLTVIPTHERLRFNSDDLEDAASAGIVLIDSPLRSIRMWAGDLTIGYGANDEAVFDDVYCAMGMEIHSRLAIDLGAEIDTSGYLKTDKHQQTSVDGLFAAGDVAEGLNQISVASGAAAIAASAIHQRLLKSQQLRY